MTDTNRLAAHYPVVGGWYDHEVYGACACGGWEAFMEDDPAASWIAHLIAAGVTLAPTTDPLRLDPDDHGHTGRLWCDPCVAHGVMLEQGVHRCAPTPDPLREALHAAQIAMVTDPETRWITDDDGHAERFIPAHVAIREVNKARAALASKEER